MNEHSSKAHSACVGDKSDDRTRYQRRGGRARRGPDSPLIIWRPPLGLRGGRTIGTARGIGFDTRRIQEGAAAAPYEELDQATDPPTVQASYFAGRNGGCLQRGVCSRDGNTSRDSRETRLGRSLCQQDNREPQRGRGETAAQRPNHAPGIPRTSAIDVGGGQRARGAGEEATVGEGGSSHCISAAQMPRSASAACQGRCSVRPNRTRSEHHPKHREKSFQQGYEANCTGVRRCREPLAEGGRS